MKRRRWLDLVGRAGIAALLPGCAGRDPGGLDLATMDQLGGEAYGVWQSGRRVAGRDPGKRMPSFSITKSLAALAVVRATGEGWLEPDQPLAGVIPEWRNDPGKRRITVRMLVNQTAGFPSGVAELYRGRIPDKGRTAIHLPLVDEPGARFRYGPASSEVLAEVLRRKLRERTSTPETFLRGLMNRIGVSSPDWRKDTSGNFYLSTGAEFSVMDLSRIGEVVANLADGKSAAGLDAAVFQDLASPRNANPMVSAGIWWNRNATRTGAFPIEPERHLDDVRPPSFWQAACLDPGVDPGWLAMVGSGGKRVYVLPSHGWVIVRLARSTRWNDGTFLQTITQQRKMNRG